jgi:CDP-4-dehydro-6-deoxyglucose reductase, E1
MLKSNQETIDKRILYAEAVFGEEEKQAVMKSMDNKWLASGPLVKEFEKKVAKLFGKKYGIAVNSGSSADLLAIQSLNLPVGSEVITPACTFSTTVSSIIHNNLVPVFIDTVIGRYTIDEDLVEKAITKKTKIIFVPQLVGSVCDMDRLRKMADKYKLVLIDDSCDTFAPYFNKKTAASYSDLTTTSFYGSHIITALGFGGMVLVDDEKLRDKIYTLRDWGRVGNDKEAFENRFNFSIDNIPYDMKFLYSELGYNLKMNEAAAAFGLVQLKRLDGFLKKRTHNFNKLKQFFSKYEKWFYLPYLLKGAQTNWLAFPLTVRSDAPFTRYDFLKHMESRRIQTRVLFSGNIIRHPVYKNLKFRVSGSLKNADAIMASSLLLGCHQALTDNDIQYVCETADEFFKKYV